MNGFRRTIDVMEISALLLLATIAFINAQDATTALKGIHLGFADIDIGGSLRARGQYQQDFTVKKYQEGDDGFGEERLRLECTLKFGGDMNLFVQLQDAHVAGLKFSKDDFYPPYSPYENPLDVRQFYFEYRNIAGTPLGVKVGRQAIFYGDNRVFGPGEWGNVGRYFWDGGKLLFNMPGCKTDLFAARQVMSNPYEIDTKHSNIFMGGLYSALTVFNPGIDLFYLLKHDNVKRFNCSTVGTRINGNVSMFFYSGTFAWQFGDTGTKKIAAYGYNAKVSYVIPKLWLAEIGGEYTYGSGDDNAADGTYRTFDGAFGAIDLFYGRMAMFAWMNLKDYQVNLDLKPTRQLSITLQHHWFELADKKDAWYYGNGKPQRKDKTGVSGASLGNELLFAVKYTMNLHLNVYAGYGRFFPGDFIRNTSGYKGESGLAFFQTEYKF